MVYRQLDPKSQAQFAEQETRRITALEAKWKMDRRKARWRIVESVILGPLAYLSLTLTLAGVVGFIVSALVVALLDHPSLMQTSNSLIMSWQIALILFCSGLSTLGLVSTIGQFNPFQLKK